MSKPLSKEYADLLCTLIAIGFIAEHQSNIKLVYEDGISESEKAKYRQLQEILYSKKINITFCSATSQNVRPCIIGETKYIFGDEQIQGIADDFMRKTQSVQAKFRETVQNKTPGAYIGCRIGLSNIEFDSPSELYLYEPEYRQLSPADCNTVSSSYHTAKDITNTLVQFLNSSFTDPSLTRSQRLISHRPEPEYQTNHLFASCHGMILAIYDYGDFLTKEMVCAELALGKDTTKVASCIPCSLFMSANGYPASATHLGRGDNWNYPAGKESDRRTTAWKKAVNSAYRIGSRTIPELGQCFSAELSKLLIGENDYKNDYQAQIPKMFLEALTFEGSFLNKICDSFARYGLC